MQLFEDHKFRVPSQPTSHYQDNAFTMAITSREQRHEYKAEFDRYYSEYQKLYREMADAYDKFRSLKNQLNTVNFEERKYRVC
jgi:uncharacterized protein Yka (UPF0111/DUF47 family)